ncbi:hypothetical protein K1719_009945 [Acacia pycnantha]|nr:hypothetical protein K1719_009945 [Acacia pycnantha]
MGKRKLGGQLVLHEAFSLAVFRDGGAWVWTRKTQESNRGGRKFWYTRKKRLQEPQMSSQGIIVIFCTAKVIVICSRLSAPFKPSGSSSRAEQGDKGKTPEQG